MCVCVCVSLYVTNGNYLCEILHVNIFWRTKYNHPEIEFVDWHAVGKLQSDHQRTYN